MAYIKFEQLELIPKRYYSGLMEFPSSTLTKICGDNGVGKSTIFHYCQKHQVQYFPSSVAFLEQKPLMALNDYTISNVYFLLTQHWKKFLVSDWEKLWQEMITDFKLNGEYKISQLSGGQNQLLKLLLTSLIKADFYFFDEPFTSLDSNMSEWWKNWILNQVQKQKTLVIIDHGQRLNDVVHKSYTLKFKNLDHVEILETDKDIK